MTGPTLTEALSLSLDAIEDAQREQSKNYIELLGKYEAELSRNALLSASVNRLKADLEEARRELDWRESKVSEALIRQQYGGSD